MAVDFNKCFAPSFSGSISQVGQERERSGKKRLFPGFKVDWGQQLNQRLDLPTMPIEAACASRTDPGPGLLVHMNHPSQLLTNTKHEFERTKTPNTSTDLQIYRGAWWLP